MSFATKTGTKWGVCAKPESLYGTAVALTPASDGLRTTKPVDWKKSFGYDGQRPGKAPGTAARLQRVGPEGRWGELEIEQEGAGGGAAYSASVVPVPHLLLRACQMKPTLDVSTPGAETYTYAPADEADYTSLTLDSYYTGEKASFAGLIGNGFEAGGNVGGIITFKSIMRAIMLGEPVESAIPGTIAYNGTIGAKAVQMALTIGTFTPVRVQSFTLKQELDIQERAFNNLDGIHGGFHPNIERKFTLELLIENPTLAAAPPYHTASTFNVGELRRLATALPLSFTVGSAQYKRWTVAADNAQLADDPRELKGAVSMVKIMLDLMPSSEVANDELSILWD